MKLLEMIPEGMRIPIACLLLGGMGVAFAESRYMTVDQFTRSYVLDLKSEIRSIERELRRPELDDEYRMMLLEQLEALIAELCYEMPEDPYCRD